VVVNEGAADVVVDEAIDEALDDETVVPQAAKITASDANKVPFFNCMFIDLPPHEFIHLQYRR
jgi:hypothetical protein